MRHSTVVNDQGLHRRLLNGKLKVHMKPTLALNLLVNLAQGHEHIFFPLLDVFYRDDFRLKGP